MNIGDIAFTDYEKISSFSGVESIEEKLIAESYLVVFNGDEYMGILSPADTVIRPHQLVIDCLTKKPSVHFDDSLDSALSLMEQHSIHVLPVFVNGKFFGTVTYKAIIDSLKEQKKEMEEYIQKIGCFESLPLFTRGISHDFNNMLTILFGYLDMARTSSDVYGFPGILDGMEKGLCELKKLTEQLDLFSKRNSSAREVLDLVPIIKNCVPFFFRGTPIELDLVCAEDLWRTNIDRNRFSQVINNMVLNAIQAMPEGGRLSLVLENCSLKNDILPLERGNYVKMSFIDTGTGIESGHLKKIFDPYYTTKKGGSGIGLAVVYSIIKSHRGFIDVRSEPGRGSCFEIYLPAVIDK